MWKIAYSLIFRVFNCNYGHECRVDLILTVGSIMDLISRLNRDSNQRILPNWTMDMLFQKWFKNPPFDENYVLTSKKLIKMFICTLIMKITTSIAEDLYNLRTIYFIISIGSVRESLNLLNLLDEDDVL